MERRRNVVLEAIERLLDRPIVGVLIMALLGGVLSHMKSVAQNMPRLMTHEDYVKWFWICTTSFLVKMVGAVLGALFVLFMWKASGWKWEYGFIAAGIFGLFSSEAFEWIYGMGKGWFQKHLGITPIHSPTGPTGP